MEQSVPKRRHIKLIPREITQKKEHNKRQLLTPAAIGTADRPIQFNSTIFLAW